MGAVHSRAERRDRREVDDPPATALGTRADVPPALAALVRRALESELFESHAFRRVIDP